MRILTWLADGLHERISGYRTAELAALGRYRDEGTSTSTLARFAELHLTLAGLADAMIRRSDTK